jgi:release factor glutamine methyltransferase
VRLLRLPGVFEPHSDSWMLAEHLSLEPLHERSRVLDLCTGSGVLAVLAAARARSGVVAVDVSRRAVLSTRINAKLNGVSVRALRGDLFEPVRGSRFDLIVSNPPYLPTPGGSSRHGASRAWEAGPLGRAFIDRICAEAPAHLHSNGTLLLVHSSVCGERDTLDALTERGLRTTVLARRRGPLGPLLRSRAGWLHERELLAPDGFEEILVIRAQLPRTPTASESAAPTRAASR